MTKNILAFVTYSLLAAIPHNASSQTFGSPPSILQPCLDPGPARIGVGPSARARECTRQICALPEYRSMIAAYAMSQRQSESDQMQALTCITRWEQDRSGKY